MANSQEQGPDLAPQVMDILGIPSEVYYLADHAHACAMGF